MFLEKTTYPSYSSTQIFRDLFCKYKKRIHIENDEYKIEFNTITQKEKHLIEYILYRIQIEKTSKIKFNIKEYLDFIGLKSNNIQNRKNLIKRLQSLSSLDIFYTHKKENIISKHNLYSIIENGTLFCDIEISDFMKWVKNTKTKKVKKYLCPFNTEWELLIEDYLQMETKYKNKKQFKYRSFTLFNVLRYLGIINDEMDYNLMLVKDKKYYRDRITHSLKVIKKEFHFLPHYKYKDGMFKVLKPKLKNLRK